MAGRKSNREERRKQIVDALLQVMSAQGYEKSSMNNIAEKAGLTSGLLHYHFKTKQEILLSAIDELQLRFENRVAAHSNKGGADALFSYADALLLLDKNASAVEVAGWVVVGAEALRQPAVKKKYASVVETHLDTLVEHALQARLGRCGKRGSKASARKLAAQVLSLAMGAYQLSLAAPEVLPKGWAAPAAKKVIEEFLEDSFRKSQDKRVSRGQK